MTSEHAASNNLVGRYRIIAELGRGGMANVYLAVAEGLGGFAKLQVVKRLKADLRDDPEMLGMFLDEARLAARLNHPNVVQTNEVGETDGQYFIAMEYLEGHTLHRICREHLHRRKAPLPLRIHLRILADMLPGLRYAHTLADFDGTPLRLVHRDVSPNNVMVTYEGLPKIVDFGVAKAVTNVNATRVGIFKGKIGYGAPEQVRCEAVDQRADVYSVGVMLWEAVAARRMWKDTTEAIVLQRVLAGELPSLREIKPDAPAELVRICERALATDPAARHPDAAALKEDLEAYIAETYGVVTTEEVGEVVHDLFLADRARVRHTVELKLAEFATDPRASIAVIDMSADLRGLPGSHPSRASLVGPPPSSNTLIPGASGSHSLSIVAPAAPQARAGRVAAVLAAAALAGGLVAWLVARPTPVVAAAPAATAPIAAAPVVTAAPAPPPPAVATPPSPATVALGITVSPAHARIFLDDEKVPGNPYETRLPADTKKHSLRATAEGFLDAEETLSLERDARIQITLRPRVAAPRAGAADVAPLAPRVAEKAKPQLDAIP